MSRLSYTCSCCGLKHDGLPDITCRAPAGWSDSLAADDPTANRLSSDFCVIGNRDYFIRCVLLVPIVGWDDSLGWGVWVSQSEANFRDYVATFPDNPERSTFGYLWNGLPLYPDTRGLRAQAHWQSGGSRPAVEIEPVDHPLYRDWRDGITAERAIEFARLTHRLS